MLQRQDIDALLISALYGELTPSQESELSTHLASHPADKAALDGLTLTRDQVRSSRILAVQLEPPQSITALLIQEAARRAPKSPAEGEGWFARFVRSFVQHPAMAAAATLVLIVGIAAVVGRNKGNQFANESENRELTATAVRDESALAPTAAGEGAAAGSNMVAQNEAPAAIPVGGAGSGSACGAGFADTGASRDHLAVNGKADSTGHAGDRMGMGVTLSEERQQGTKIATVDGLVVDHRAEAPKDFVSDEKKAPEKESTCSRGFEKAKNQVVDKQSVDGDDAASMKGGATMSAKAPGTSASGGAAPPPPAQPAQQYASPPTVSRPANNAPTTPTTAPAPAKTPAPRVVAPVAPTAEPPKPEPRTEAKPVAKSETKAFEQKAPAETSKADVAKSDPTTEWAKTQHASLVAKARGNQCTAAADLAVQIENRAPGYYAQFVANDRDLKACQPTITAAREKEAEKRASVERAKKAGAEPKAAKKPDAPSATTTTDSK
ncbi:hypothetical protein BH11MYX2_BH11MYX2_02190 [soil metagenome]